MTKKFNPKNSVCVITGGSSGIGRAIAQELITQGAKQIINIDVVDPDYDCEYFYCNILDSNQYDIVLGTIHDQYTDINMICGNVGQCVLGNYQTSISQWKQIFDLNLHSHIQLVQRFLPSMINKQSGTMLFTASAAGLLTMIGSATYAASKSALLSFAEVLAYEHTLDGVGIHALCPEGVNTAMAEYDDPYTNQIKKGKLIGDYMECDAVAKTCVDQMSQGRFRIYTHQTTEAAVYNKHSDNQSWLKRMSSIYDENIRHFFAKKVD